MVGGYCSGTLESGQRGDNQDFFWGGYGCYFVILLILIFHRSYS
jgi:hypothetical protein